MRLFHPPLPSLTPSNSPQDRLPWMRTRLLVREEMAMTLHRLDTPTQQRLWELLLPPHPRHLQTGYFCALWRFCSISRQPKTTLSNFLSGLFLVNQKKTQKWSLGFKKLACPDVADEEFDALLEADLESLSLAAAGMSWSYLLPFHDTNWMLLIYSCSIWRQWTGKLRLFKPPQASREHPVDPPCQLRIPGKNHRQLLTQVALV